MKRYHFGLPAAILGLISLLLVSSGLGAWVFLSGNTEAKADVSLNVKDNLFIDDIAENYYYASDTKASNFYNVYFFPSPAAANYSGSSSSTVETYKVTSTGTRSKTQTSNKQYGTYSGGTFSEISWSDWGNDTLTDASTDSGSGAYSNPVDFYDNTEGGESSSSGSSSKSDVTDNSDSTFVKTETSSPEKYIDWWEPWKSKWKRTVTETYTKTGYYTVRNSNTGNGLHPATKQTGYWGSSSNMSTTVDLATNDHTIYGYKSFKSVYKQLDADSYLSLGDLFCTYVDSSSWYGYFAGFTTDAVAAKNNLKDGGYSVPQVDLFDLNQPLSYYDTDGDQNIYLYALYTNGKDYSASSGNRFPGVHIVPNDFKNVRDTFQWMFLPSAGKWSFGSQSSSFFYSLKNVQVKNQLDGDSLLNVYYRNQNYRLQTDHLNSSGNYDGAWLGWQNYGSGSGRGDFNIDFSSLINENVDDGSVYNFYVYYNEKAGDYSVDDMKNDSVDTKLNEKNIVRQSDISSSANNGNLYAQDYDGNYYFYINDKNNSGVTSYMKVYVERVYNYKITGDLTSSYDYSSVNSYLPLKQDSSINDIDNTNIFYSKPIIFSEKTKLRFGFNYGSDYSTDYQLDDSATGTNYPCYVEGTTDGEISTDPSGNKVYYTTDDNLIFESANQNEETNKQNIKIFEIAHTGVYRFRINVEYSNGKPSVIKVSAAYLRGAFIEIHDTDPTSMIEGSAFVDHSNYAYRCDADYDTEIGINDLCFYRNGSDYTEKLSLSDIINAKGTDAVLYDHVTGAFISITKNGFSKDSGNTYTSTFTLSKDYIFYWAK